MKFHVYLLISIGFILSCEKKNENDFPDITIDFENKDYIDKSDFFESFHSDTLEMYVNLDECGEWGGPKEIFKIYKKDKINFMLRYEKYKFSCDSISYYYGFDTIIDYKKEIEINKIEKKLLSSFFEDLIKAKINEVQLGNFGSVYELNNSDSTLNILVYTNKTDIKKRFLRLKEKLKLE